MCTEASQRIHSLVQSDGEVGVAWDDKFVPVALLLGSPKHGGELQAENVVLRLPRAPRVKAIQCSGLGHTRNEGYSQLTRRRCRTEH